MFEKFRKEQRDRHAEQETKLAALEVARTAAERQLARDEIPQLEEALRNLKSAHADAEFPVDGSRTLCRDLDERIGMLKRRVYELALRPCTHCGGRDFRISDERNLEFFGDLRLVVCEGCGLTQIFWADLRKLDSSRYFSKTFRVPEGGGPFR